jgi:hypothetical protein
MLLAKILCSCGMITESDSGICCLTGVGNGGGLTSRRILSWLLVAVVTGGIDSRGAAKEGGQIGRGYADDVEGLSVLVSGDHGPTFERVVRENGTNGVNEGGGTFSWSDEGCIVGNAVSSLVNSGVEGDVIDCLFIVVDGRGEFWYGWILVYGKREHNGSSFNQRVLIWLGDD